MFTNYHLNYTIGEYCEYPRGLHTPNIAELLIGTLAWAVKHQFPLHEAVLSLTYQQPVEDDGDIKIKINAGWNDALIHAALDLERGCSLNDALRNNLATYLPENVLRIIEKAENENRLPEVLAGLTKRMGFMYDVRNMYKVNLAIPVIEATFCFIVLSFLTLFTVPRFLRISEELLEGGADTVGMDILNTWAYQLIPAVWGYFFGHPINVCCTFLLIIGGVFIWRRHGRTLVNLVMEILIHIPLVSKFIYSYTMVEFCGTMAACLAAGDSMIKATRLTCDTCSQFWLKRRLQGILNEMENGVPFLQAWERFNHGKSLEQWAVRNAFVNERPAEGFDFLLDWHYYKLALLTRRCCRSIEILITLFVAAVVCLTVYAFFENLVFVIIKYS